MNEKDKKVFDNTIDALIDSVASDAVNEMFDEIDASINDDEIVFSDKHIKKINKILSLEKHTAEKIKYHKINKRILLVAVIVMVISLSAAISVGADRLKFLNYFMNINKTDTEFRSDDKIYDEEYYFSIAKSIIPESWSVDTENAKTKYVDINGNKAFLSIKHNVIALCWINNDSLYMIDGNIDEETLITIAKNLE